MPGVGPPDASAKISEHPPTYLTSGTHLIIEHDASNALWIPEQLVHVVISDDILVIPLPPHELAIDNLVALITIEV